MTKKIFCGLFMVLLCFFASAQSTTDSLFYSKSKSNAISFFEQRYDPQLAINKGTIFRQVNLDEYYGTTILGKNLIYKGNVVFQGETYADVDLAYDVKSDNLIHVKTTGEWILLLKSAVAHFNLGDRNFVNLSVPKQQINGFYEVLSAGTTQVLAKHRIVANRYYPGTFKKELEVKTVYFIQNKSMFYPIKSKNDLANALIDKKKEVLNFMKEQSLSLKDNEVQAIKAVVNFYNNLN